MGSDATLGGPSAQHRERENAIPARTFTSRPDAREVADLVTRLTADFGDRALTSRAVRDGHSHGEGLADAGLPDVVVFPHTNDEVAAIVRLCHAARVPGHRVRRRHLARGSRRGALRRRVLSICRR